DPPAVQCGLAGGVEETGTDPIAGLVKGGHFAVEAEEVADRLALGAEIAPLRHVALVIVAEGGTCNADPPQRGLAVTTDVGDPDRQPAPVVLVLLAVDPEGVGPAFTVAVQIPHHAR